MKIYLAAMYSRREEMEKIAEIINKSHHEVVARWVYGGEEGLTRDQIAELDLEDVDRADAVVSFTHPRGTLTPNGGRHVEFGYGLAKGKRMILIGPPENVFHEHKSVETYISLADWLANG